MKGVILIGWLVGWLVREENGICLLVFRVRRDGRTDGREDGMGYGISVVTSIIDLEGMIDAYLTLGWVPE